MEPKYNGSLGFWGWLGIIILLGFLFFKWIPDWTWRAKTPEITINDSIFEARPVWQDDKALLSRNYPPDVYIRIQPEEAVDSRAKLVVSVNGKNIDENCSYGGKYFCHKISGSNIKNGDQYEIIAKNTAGEKRVVLEIKIGTNASSSSESNQTNSTQSPSTSSPTGASSSEPESIAEPPQSNPKASAPSTVPYVQSSSCLHYEAGRCWDDLENEMYSSGLYDHNYGYHGGSFMPPDDCDSRCQDILEDAYEEGYYDF